jgi:hypothetical protein
LIDSAVSRAIGCHAQEARGRQQIGLLGRSIFEKLRPGIGWWGSYVKKKPDGNPSRLYTTSGFGHWFPFRFGCPTEMAIVVLEGMRRERADAA